MEKDYNFKEPFYYKNFDVIQSASQRFGYSSIDTLDQEFFHSFIMKNYPLLASWVDKQKNFEEIARKLVIPKIQSYKVVYNIKTTEFIEEIYETIHECYDADLVSDSLKESLNSGAWDYFNGKLLEREVYDSNIESWNVESITKYTNEQFENTILNIISENTEKSIDGLDRETLLKIKKIIDDKLNSF